MNNRFVRDATRWLVAATLVSCLRNYHETHDIDAMDGHVQAGDSAVGDGADAIATESGIDADVGIDVGADVTCIDGALNDPRNCGACGHDCTRLPQVAASASVTCSNGTCVIPPGACTPGFAHCSANPDDGCETPIDHATHCGSCQVACSGSTPYCVVQPAVHDAGTDASVDATSEVGVDAAANDAADVDAAPVDAAPDTGPPFNGTGFYMYMCSSSCPASAPTTCGTTNTCTNLQTDPHNCAGCQQGCRVPANGIPTCAAGVCGIQCIPGFHNCANECVDSQSPDTCGSSCTPCAVPMHASGASCVSAMCVPLCVPGYQPQGNTCVPIPGPQLIAPISVSVMNTDQPVLSMLMPPGETAARVDVCHDRACTTVEMSQMVMGTGMQSVTAMLRTGTHFWRATTIHGGVASPISSPTWEFIVPPLPTPRPSAPSAAMGYVLDLDGDGFADIAVDDGNSDRVFFGGLGGLGAALLTLPTGSGFGGLPVVSALADIDGDGFSDLVVGPGNGSSASLCRGGTNTRMTVSCALVFGGMSVVFSAGDFDGDGYGDVIGGNSAGGSRFGPATIAFGPMLGRPRTIAGTFNNCTAIGDFNADGLGDVACARAGSPANIALILGSPMAPVMFTESTPMLSFGAMNRLAVGGVRDVNGDGFADLGYTAFDSQTRMAVYAGNCLGRVSGTCVPSAPQTLPMGQGGGGVAGLTPTIVGAGDSDGDGFADAAVALFGLARARGNALGLGLFGANLGGGSTGTPDDVTGADFNGDHLADLVWFDGGTNTFIVFNGGSTTTTQLPRTGGLFNLVRMSAMAR